MKRFSPLLLSAVLGISSTARSAQVEIECPEEVKTKQTALPLKGWASHVDAVNARQLFSGLTLFNGHPKDTAPLFPDEVPATASGSADAKSTTTESIYKVPAGRDAYVECQYTNTLVRLIKKLPKDVQVCRVKFSETLGHVQKAVCE